MKRPEIEVEIRWRENWGLEIRESQCLDTDLNLVRGLMGSF